eukprot:COSAG01_NODE_638_length_14605_cov_46.266097_3_plen_113_part_00
MHEGGLAAVSRAESAVHRMDSTVCPHGGGWHRLRRSCWGSRRSDDDGSYRRGADDFYCGIRSSWINKQIKKRRHVKDLKIFKVHALAVGSSGSGGLTWNRKGRRRGQAEVSV